MVKRNKGGVIAVAVIFVVIIALIVVASCMSSDSNQYKLFNMFVPSKLTDEVTGITFYAEKNPDFVYDAETSNVLNSMKYYYYPNGDTSHEKIYISNGTFYSEDKGTVHVDLGFTFAALQKVNKIKTGLKIGAGVLAAVPVSTTGAAEFQDGADTQNFIWAAGEETSTDTDESKGVSANDSVVEGLDKPLVFYPNTYYKFNVTGAGTQNTNPAEGDVRWTPLYWSLSLKPQESDIHRKWEIGSAKGIYTKVERAYNIYIFFQREEYTGGIWEKNDIVQPVRYQFNAAPLTEQGGSYKYLIGGIGYKILNEREVSVTGLAAEYNVIQIPATVVINDKVYKVTTIDKNAFSGNKEITDVIFGNNVTTIGKYAFSQCPNLRNIRFGSRVKRIGSNAFAQCTKLRNFILPASVRHIDARAFYQCPAVKVIRINSAALNYVGKKAFAVNKTVTIRLPEKLFARYQKLIKASGVYSKTRFVKY